MKKRLVAVTAMILSIAIVFPAAAYPGGNPAMSDDVYYGQWVHDANGDWFRKADGSYVTNEWLQIGYLNYYFDGNGYVLKDTITPDGHRVDHFGARIDEWNRGTEPVLTKTDDYDPEFPLKGRLDEFGLGMTAEYTTDEAGRERWYYYFNSGNPRLYNADDDVAALIREGNYYPYYNEDLALYRDVIALLADLPVDRTYWNYSIGSVPDNSTERIYDFWKLTSGQEITQLADEVRRFLNSFDWRKSSDYEKALRAAEWVSHASYSYDTVLWYYGDNLPDGLRNVQSREPVKGQPDYSAYGAMVWHDAVCSGFAEAYNLLTRCMGMRSGTASAGLHEWNVIWIDGRLYKVDISANKNNTIDDDYILADDITDKEAFGFYPVVLEDIR